MARHVVDPKFPAALREIRTERGLSLRDLEKRVFLSRSVLSDMEKTTLR